MKAIKLTETNAAAIEAALKAVNGTATAHTYTTAAEILALASRDEARAVRILGSQKAAVGAVATHESGDRVANSYDYGRVGTAVTIERRATGWFLVGVAKATIYKNGGKHKLLFTPDQDRQAHEIVRREYAILRTAVPANVTPAA